MSDCLVVGGGVIGLSLAYELAGHGMRVRVIDAGQPAREASWAGAGILPPVSAEVDDPLEQLTALSNQLHRQWSQTFREQVGIDNGYRRCGAIYVAREGVERQRLERFAAQAHSRAIVVEPLTRPALREAEPALEPDGILEATYLMPDECQIRNPRHLKGLLAACAGRGVEITAGVAAEDFEFRGSRLRSVRTNLGSLAADRVCVTAGSWTGALARKLGIAPAIRPIRGQMVLLSTPLPVVGRIINEGSRYLVPRDDGRLLAGSTEEDVGFDRGTTAGAVSGLLEFAFSLVPRLKQAQIERSWAGLRPSTCDGLPYLGRVEAWDNVFVAAGHFRGGLQLSTGTAVLMSQLIRGEQPQIDLSAFRLERDQAEPASQNTLRHKPRQVPQH